MYYYGGTPCASCAHYATCMSMANNMPTFSSPAATSTMPSMAPMMTTPMQSMPMQSMPVQSMPMVSPTVYDPSDALEGLYPSIYHKVRPMVVVHIDQLKIKHGGVVKLTKDELEAISKEIYEQIKDEIEDEADDDDDDDDNKKMRRRRYGKRRAVRDLIGIVLLTELLGRGPGRPPYYGGYPGYGYGPGYSYVPGYGYPPRY